jgi:hypothetical protein
MADSKQTGDSTLRPVGVLAAQMASQWKAVRPNDARIGCALEKVDTPALVLDLDKFTHNLVAMQRFCDEVCGEGEGRVL